MLICFVFEYCPFFSVLLPALFRHLFCLVFFSFCTCLLCSNSLLQQLFSYTNSRSGSASKAKTYFVFQVPWIDSLTQCQHAQRLVMTRRGEYLWFRWMEKQTKEGMLLIFVSLFVCFIILIPGPTAAFVGVGFFYLFIYFVIVSDRLSSVPLFCQFVFFSLSPNTNAYLQFSLAFNKQTNKKENTTM